MGSSNTFSRAMKHLKADKPSGLFESVPTNNTQDLYQVEPDTLVEINPDIDVPDFDQDGDGSNAYTGEDTSGLFMPDGTIRVIEPPGDTTAILGPMATMWYAWGNFSTFGYIRQSDRRMVNLEELMENFPTGMVSVILLLIILTSLLTKQFGLGIHQSMVVLIMILQTIITGHFILVHHQT